MKYFRRHSSPVDSHGSEAERRIPVAPSLAAVGKVAACTTSAAAFAFFLLAVGLPSVLSSASAAAEPFFCTFAISPTDCGFEEQGKVQGRATLVNFGRDGGTALRLHTEPGDDNVAGSGAMRRNDVWLSQAQTDGYEGREHWWAHSILFPDDFAMPTWHMYVVFDFHNTASGGGQANFHINFAPQADPTQPGNLVFRGYGGAGGAENMANPYGAVAVAGPVAKNVWYDFVYHVRWSSGPDGFFDAWVNGVQKLSHRGPTLYAGQGVYLKLANYHTPVCEPFPACIGSDPPSSVIHDRVVRGTTWQDVLIGNTQLEGQYEESAASYNSSLTPSSWMQYGPTTGTFSGGTIEASDEANATATFTFTGTSVAWMGVKCNICGIATVSIDGGAPTTVDTAGPGAPGSLTPESVFSASGLAAGVSHKMVITVTGQTNSGGTYIVVDGFWVTPIAPN